MVKSLLLVSFDGMSESGILQYAHGLVEVLVWLIVPYPGPRAINTFWVGLKVAFLKFTVAVPFIIDTI